MVRLGSRGIGSLFNSWDFSLVIFGQRVQGGSERLLFFWVGGRVNKLYLEKFWCQGRGWMKDVLVLSFLIGSFLGEYVWGIYVMGQGEEEVLGWGFSFIGF